MKKGVFKGLLFRELYLARKTYVICTTLYLLSIVLSLLALLSYQCGNLYRYYHLMDETLKTNLHNVIKYLPAIIAAGFLGSGIESIPYDEKTSWRRFRTACPATPFQFALAKYSCFLTTLLLPFALAFGWFGLYSLLTGETIANKDFRLILAIYSLIVLFIIFLSILSIWLNNNEIAAIIALLILFTVSLPIINANQYLSEADVKALFETLLTLAPLTILPVLLLGLLLTTKLYQRREK